MFNGVSQLGLIKKSLLLVLPLAASAVVWVGSASADYGSGAIYQVELSTEDFPPGRYRLVLYGVDDAPVPLAVYTIRLYEP